MDPPPAKKLDLEAWRAELFRNRQVQIKRLRQYAKAGNFPIYYGPDGLERVHHRELTDREPVFVDSHGTHCAVGYLMDRSGWSGAVAEIAKNNNNVYVEEVDDGALIRWIEVSGLTQQEAAFIQPSYNWKPRPRPRPKPIEPEPPPPPQEFLTKEIARLRAHFAEVDKQLRQDAEMSIDEALHRLEPRIEAGRRLGTIS